jgi:hypothetical protein
MIFDFQEGEIMEEAELKMGMQITIKESGIIGTVSAKWESLYGKTQWQVRYYSTTGCRQLDWFLADELTIT